MVSAYVGDLERFISKARLDRYRPPNGDDLETAVAHLWNVALSESLLQGLSAVEVALRNSIHNTMTVHGGTDMWFWSVLLPNELKTIHDTWLTLAKRHKHPPTAGKIIAELTFGFWPLLFDTPYQQLWWNNGASLFKATFPHLPSGQPAHLSITRKDVHARVARFPKQRNRVMHHEPIYFGLELLNVPTVPLASIHQDIVDLLRWIDPQLALTLSFVDRFPDVHQHEESRIRQKLKTYFGIP